MAIKIEMPMPESCGKCRFERDYEVNRFDEGHTCTLTGGEVSKNVKPWWCPLKEADDVQLG